MEMIDVLTPDSIAASILLLRDVHHGSILVLEGDTDIRLFKKFIDHEQCQLVNAFNKNNVIRIFELLDESDFEGCVGIVDADFSRVENENPGSPNLFMTDSHDIETMIIRSPAFDHLLEEFGSESKIRSYEKKYGIGLRESIRNVTVPIGYFRLLSKRRGLGLRFKEIKFSKFIKARKELLLEIHSFVASVLNHSQRHDLESGDLKKELEALIDPGHDPWQIICGHDFVSVLSISLRKLFGSSNANSVQVEILEMSLRLAYQFSHFEMSDLHSCILGWQQATGFQVLAYPG